MDAREIFQMIDEATFEMENSTCDELMNLLNFVEYVVIDGKRTELFQKRINYICLANCFASTMKRDYQCKQIKTFLKNHGGFEDSAAQQVANKLNEARRVYPRLETIVSNCCSIPNVDIRDLTIHELYLANSLTWVIKRGAEVKSTAKVPNKIPVPVDADSVRITTDQILNSDWYKQACGNPSLVASILTGITTRVINDSVYKSQR